MKPNKVNIINKVESNELAQLHQANNVATITNKKYIKDKQQIFPRIVLGNISDDNVNILGDKLILRHGSIVKPNKYDRQVFQRFPQYRFWSFKDQKMYYPKDIKSIEFGDNQENAENAENKDNKENAENAENAENKDNKDNKENKDNKDNKDNKEFKIITISNGTYLSSEGVLMEYTHIEDNKGNRLCEGDILRDGTEIFFLYYDPNESAFETKSFKKSVRFSIGMYFERADGTEIIGNVYENCNIVNNEHSLEIARFYDFKNKQLTKENKKYLLENDFVDLMFKKDIFKNNALIFQENNTDKSNDSR